MYNKYLIMVDPIHNNNKYYKMYQTSSCSFCAEYGRIGQKGMKKNYPLAVFQDIYFKKLSKGYMDVTDKHFSAGRGKNFVFDNERVEKLFLTLLKYSSRSLESNYSSPEEVTPEMIREANCILNQLGDVDDVFTFNSILIELFKTIPRKMKNVDDYLISDISEKKGILASEYDLLDSMKSKVKITTSESSNLLETLGLSAEPVTDAKRIGQIKKHLGESARFFDEAFRIHNKKCEERFSQFMKDHHYSEKNIHYLYHGSRNQNWISLLEQGLILHPNAIKTGSMFGHGLYFAPRAKKSIGYTSLDGQNPWTKERCNQAFLAVFKVLYKNQKDIHSFSSECSRFNYKNIQPHDAVFAHKGQMLYNDEVIVYQEPQCVIQYLISLKN